MPNSTITFSEFPLRSQNPTFRFADNVVTTTGIIVTDGAQPRSPVLAANTSYLGPVFVYFKNPVSFASVDVGYFDSIGSTRIEFRDVLGNIVYSRDNDGFGVKNFSFASETGIRSISAIDYKFDQAGFSLDTVVFGEAVAVELPPIVTGPSGFTLFPDRDFGRIAEANYRFVGTLGDGDEADTIRFVADRGGTVNFTTYLNADPSNVLRYTLAFEVGDSYISLKQNGIYESQQPYTVNFKIVFSKDTKEKAMDDFLKDAFSDAFGSVLDFKEKQNELFQEMFKTVDNAEDAVKILGKMKNIFGVFGKALDLTEAYSEIRAAAD